jgi:hypothetical protein
MALCWSNSARDITPFRPSAITQRRDAGLACVNDGDRYMFSPRDRDAMTGRKLRARFNRYEAT